MRVRETDVEIESGGDFCRAWLFVPEEPSGPLPCIVMGHGFGLTRRCGLRGLALAFAASGYAVMLFDYRGFGDSGGTPRQLISFRKQLEDWGAVIAFVRARPEVDSNRIVTWGFSLGAGHALTIAARDEGVAAVVAVTPMFSGISSTLAAMKGWTPFNFLRIVARGIRDAIGALFRRPPVLVPLAAPPGEIGLLTSPDAYPGYRAMVPPDFIFGTAARIALVFWTYLPGLVLRRFTRPVLVLPSRIDKINPPGPTLRRAGQCKSARIVELECEHMQTTEEPHRSRIVASTLEFLNDCLPSRKVE